MRRGDVVLVAMSGAYGKPRPALVIQSNLFSEHPSVTVCIVTSHLQDAPLFRYGVEPFADNGLKTSSHVQIDKIMTVPREKIGEIIGHLADKQMSEINKLIALWLGFGT